MIAFDPSSFPALLLLSLTIHVPSIAFGLWLRRKDLERYHG